MDASDIKILKLLQKNARITASEIGREISLSIPAVSERLKKLEGSGIIQQYTAVLNPRLLKRELTALMLIGLAAPKFNDRFLEFVAKEDQILECHYIAGDFDYILKIMTESTGRLGELLNNIKGICGVQRTKTIVAISTVKNNFSLTLHDEEL